MSSRSGDRLWFLVLLVSAALGPVAAVAGSTGVHGHIGAASSKVAVQLDSSAYMLQPGMTNLVRADTDTSAPMEALHPARNTWAHSASLLELARATAQVQRPVMKPGLCDDDLVGNSSRKIIQDSAISASSYWGSDIARKERHGMNGNLWRSRPDNINTSWCAHALSKHEWIEWNFGSGRLITGMKLYPRGNQPQYVTKFRVQYVPPSPNATEFVEYAEGDELEGCRSASDVKVHSLEPFKAVKVRIMPTGWMEHICLRATWIGCKESSRSKPSGTKNITVSLSSDELVERQVTKKFIRESQLIYLTFSNLIMAIVLYLCIGTVIRRMYKQLHEERVDAEIAFAARDLGVDHKSIAFLKPAWMGTG